MKLVFTGGHHSSAIPVLKLLKTRHPEVEIFWFGHKYSLQGDKNVTLEYQEVSALGIKFYELRAGKFYKTYNIIRLLKIPFGFMQAVFLLVRLRPAVIVSFGGYLAVPTVLAGKVLGIPSITHEQTVVVGYANKVISKYAHKIMISWPESAKYFPPEKTVLTGIPLRDEIFTANSDEFKINVKLPTVLVMGGKTGAHKINLTVEEVLPELLHICNVLHQCGAHSEFKDAERLAEKYKGLVPQPPGKYFGRQFIYESEIGEAYAKADIFVTRAGAHTLAEILAIGKRAILIPIPWVSHNEQYLNAKALENAGLGVILEEANLTGQALLALLKSELVQNGTKINLAHRGSVQNTAAELILHEIQTYL